MTPSTTTGTRAAAPPTMKPERRQLQPSQRGERRERSGGDGLQVAVERLLDDRDLPGEGDVVDAGAAAGHRRRRLAR